MSETNSVNPNLGSITRKLHAFKTMRSIDLHTYEIGISALVDARKRAGISQRELARKIGQHQSFVSKYENKERRLDFAEFRIICDALDLDLSEIWNGDAR